MKEEIVQSLDLKEIGCNMTQGEHYCEINVPEDGKTVYLHRKQPLNKDEQPNNPCNIGEIAEGVKIIENNRLTQEDFTKRLNTTPKTLVF